MYTRKIFGEKLKIKVANKEEFEKIGNWAHKMYMENIMDVDQEFRKILLTIGIMEEGPEFAYSYEELEKIADDLILGREVKL